MLFFKKYILFSFLLLLPTSLLFAWNEDFTATLPSTHRAVCIPELSNLWKGKPVKIRSITADEACQPGEARYRWVIGKEPKNSMALLVLKAIQKAYPPWVPSWPSHENTSGPRVWHFTCVGDVEKELLGTKMKSFTFKGEITAPSQYQSCESAYMMAQGACKEQLGGNDLYEQCSGGTNYLLELP